MRATNRKKKQTEKIGTSGRTIMAAAAKQSSSPRPSSPSSLSLSSHYHTPCVHTSMCFDGGCWLAGPGSPVVYNYCSDGWLVGDKSSATLVLLTSSSIRMAERRKNSPIRVHFMRSAFTPLPLYVGVQYRGASDFIATLINMITSRVELLITISYLRR